MVEQPPEVIAPSSLPLFVWSSNSFSTKYGILSAVGALEVVISVLLFWQATEWLQTRVFLVVALFVAPLLLMRSDVSVTLGVKWLEDYWDRSFADVLQRPDVALKSLRFWCSINAALTVGMISAFLFAHFGLSGHEGWAGIWRGGAIGFFAMQAAVAITAACAAKQVLAITRVALLQAAIGLFIVGCAAVAIAIMLTGRGSTASVLSAGLVAGAVVAAGSIVASEAAADAVASGEMRGVSIARNAVRRRTLSFAACFLGLLIGAWLRTVGIRFFATLRHPVLGWRAIPNNWWRTVFVTDIFVAPEVVPGYTRDDPFNVSYVIRRLSTHPDRQVRAFYIPILLVLFGPACFYRLYIKSTCWFYIPLVYISRAPALAQRPEYLSDILSLDKLEWWRRMLAVASIGGFFAITCLPGIAMQIRYTTPIMISPLEFLFLVDFEGVKPWQWCTLLGALITLGLFVLASRFRIMIDHARFAPELNKSIARWSHGLEFAMRVRNICTWLILLFALVHVALWLSPLQTYLNPRVLSWLRFVYGNAMPLPP